MLKFISILPLLLLPFATNFAKSSKLANVTFDPCSYDWTYQLDYSNLPSGSWGKVRVDFSLQSVDIDVFDWTFGVNPAYVEIVQITPHEGATVIFDAYNIALVQGVTGRIYLTACSVPGTGSSCSDNNICKTITMLVP